MMNLKIYDSRDFPGYLPKLNSLYDDLLTSGKGFRSKLIQKIASQIGLTDRTTHLLCQTVEFIHNASLLHDDLIDRSPLRRGKPAAWTKYSAEYAVLAGDYLLARVMVNLSGFGNLQLVQYTAEVISDLLEGEWLQDSLVGDMNVDLSQLDRVHNLKTASLFKWCFRSPFIAQGRQEVGLHTQLEEAGTLLGQLFQRADDLLDYDVRNHEGKNPLGDLKAGYLNSFAAFALKNQSKEGIRALGNLDDFVGFVGGQQAFEGHVKQFDQQNQFLIQLYEQRCRSVENYLEVKEKNLIPFLLSLPDLLYWRKVSN